MALTDPVVNHLERVAVVEDEDVLLVHAKVDRELGMGAKVLGLAVNGHEITGLGHGEHKLELLLGPVARDMHERLVLVVNGAADLRERVDDRLDALLVAGNGCCGNDHSVARVDGERLVLTVCHASKSGERLALRARAEHDNLVVVELVDLESVDDVVLGDFEVSKLAGDLRVGNHGATRNDDLAACRGCGIAHLLKPVDVRREARDEDAPLGVLDNVTQVGSHGGLRGRVSRPGGVRGVGKKKVDTIAAELIDGLVVGPTAVDGSVVELEVARVHDRTGRRLNINAERAGNGVSHREEREVEGTEIDVRAVLDLTEFRTLDLVLGELALDHAEGELARIDGDLLCKVHEQVRQGTGVVFVAVGDHNAAKLVLVLENIGVIRQDKVDSGHVVIGEHESSVDEDHVVPVLEGGHVLADTIKATQRNDLQGNFFLWH